LVPCSSFACTPNNINAIGGIADEAETIRALESLYASPEYRSDLRDFGLDLMSSPEYRWENVGARFAETMTACLSPLVLEQVPEGPRVTPLGMSLGKQEVTA
jgi:hypothetical protein